MFFIVRVGDFLSVENRSVNQFYKVAEIEQPK